ncbi:four helix bundle protein [Neolewinella agarilytica]|uniref:four helix bundle protein n=1 Tax=Neolewinella agarilytica TaxID=478744 RepID=UPI0023524D73|nr:four helix bundle protein [Neolewinella agarilytica]
MGKFKAMILDLLYLFADEAPDPDFSIENFVFEELPVDKNDTQLLADPQSEYGKSTKKSKEEFVTWLKARTKKAAIEIINLMENTGNSPGLNVVRYQLIKSSTSSAANYRAACRARSVKEFYAKMCIVVEETDETVFWLEILNDSKIKVDKSTISKLQKEWTEILKIMAKAKHNAYPATKR